MIEVSNKAARLPKWKLQLDDGESEYIELPSQLKVNTITACLTACVDGLGLAVLPEFICREHFKTDRLVHLLPNNTTCHKSRYWCALMQLMSKRKKVFIDYLLTAFQSRNHE